MHLRQRIFSTITNIFTLHGGVTIDTPVFELNEILSNKYGEDSKLIYSLADQGGELCSLRYDLTVPFARYLAMTGTEKMKRYHIAKVYRRDQPAMTKGRLREFYQCDFDIAGVYDPMIPDAEIILITEKVLKALDVGEFTIKLNHRKILNGMLEVCGVPKEKMNTISSAVDKLDKLSWADVKKEMVIDKGLDDAAADKIGEYVKLKGGNDLLEKLKSDAVLTSNKSALEGLEDMAKLFTYLSAFSVKEFTFDLSLARGLDYYTGVIFEAVSSSSAPPAASLVATSVPNQTEEEDAHVGVGSIAGGGRYDELVGMFSEKGSKGKVPCVGISFGVERIFSIVSKRWGKELLEGKGKEVDAYVLAVGGSMLEERMKVMARLWDGGIRVCSSSPATAVMIWFQAEFMYKTKPKTRPQFDEVARDRVKYAIIIGPEEWKNGEVLVKEQVTDAEKREEEERGEPVPLSSLVDWLKGRLRA
ncbi:histidyl-tRNA synthetase [Atractiella rhizophila]|nr:histidyl-tRNA synthetase [Atractiella rhizophila]